MSRFAKKGRPRALPIHTQAVESAYLSLQRTQRALVGMLAVCAVLGMTIFRAKRAMLGTHLYLPMILATSLLTFAYTLRNSMVLPSLAELRRNPRDPKLLKRWSRNNLIVLSFCAAVGLTGFALQLLGAATPLALTLYAIAVAYLFLLRPLRP